MTHVLQPPFWVIATQNPIDHEGTFPLPEAQLDRFLVRFSLGYPSMEEELRMLDLLEQGNPLDRLEPVVSAEELLAAQQAVREIHVDPKIRHYITEIVQDTRTCEDLSLGGSPAGVAGVVPLVAGLGRGVGAKLRAARRRETTGRPRADPSPDPPPGEPPAEAHGRVHCGRGRLPRVPVPMLPDATNTAERRPLGICLMNWLIAAVLLLLAALALGLGLPTYAMYVLLGILLVSRWLARHWIKNLSALRECNRYTVNVGDTVAVVITLTNTGKLPVAWVLIEDLLFQRPLTYTLRAWKVHGDRIQLALLKGGGRHTMFYQLECKRRGFHQIGPLVVETGDLFGLYRRFRVLASPHFLTVYPEVVPLEGFELASRRPSARSASRTGSTKTPPASPACGATRPAIRSAASTGGRPPGPASSTAKFTSRPASSGPRCCWIFTKRPTTRAMSRTDRNWPSAPRPRWPTRCIEMDQQIGLVTNGRDAADRIREEGWDYDIRSRRAARRVAELAGAERSAAAAGRRDPPRAGATDANPGNARPGGTDRRAELRPVGDRDGGSASPRRHGGGVVPGPSVETAVALGELSRKGLAVTAILNLYDDLEFEAAAAQLAAEGIRART